MDVITSIFNVFTEILEWFGDALGTVSAVFYTPGAGEAAGEPTFIGYVTLITFGIGLTTLVLAWVRSLMRGR